MNAVPSYLDTLPALAPSIDGAQLLDDVHNFIGRFCAFPSGHAQIAVTLWAAHTHAIGHFYTTPRLILSSPEAGSGKTRVLEVLDLLVSEPMFSLNASPPAIFRTLCKRQVTLLMDEVDAIFSKKGKDDSHEDLRALLNAGYKRGATIPRCVGPRHDVTEFPVYAAVALAGLGDMPDTIMTRSVIIRMRRRAPGEKVDPFRSREHSIAGQALGRRLGEWAAMIGPDVGDAWPTLPEGIVDRPAEIWEPLLAMADAAGGHWPATARLACTELCRSALDRRISLGMRLLGDVKIVFGGAIALHTEVIIERLRMGEPSGLAADAPWAELHGKPINARQLAAMLKTYSVNSTKVTIDGRSLQGYRREHLWDAWQRYLPPSPELMESPELLESMPAAAPEAVPETPQVPPIPESEGAIPTEEYAF
jgi:hypothetical protein